MADWTPLVLAELVLVFGGVLAWGAWELHVLRREKARREQHRPPPPGGGDAGPPSRGAAS